MICRLLVYVLARDRGLFGGPGREPWRVHVRESYARCNRLQKH